MKMHVELSLSALGGKNSKKFTLFLYNTYNYDNIEYMITVSYRTFPLESPGINSTYISWKSYRDITEEATNSYYLLFNISVDSVV